MFKDGRETITCGMDGNGKYEMRKTLADGTDMVLPLPCGQGKNPFRMAVRHLWDVCMREGINGKMLDSGGYYEITGGNPNPGGDWKHCRKAAFFPRIMVDGKTARVLVWECNGGPNAGKRFFLGDRFITDDGYKGEISYGSHDSSGHTGGTELGFYVRWEGEDNEILRNDLLYWLGQNVARFIPAT